MSLISSIVAYFQLHIAILNYQAEYLEKCRSIVRLLSLPTSRNAVVTRLNRRRQAKLRRYWTRPGRTSAWWDNFVVQVIIREEWKENFRMGRASLYLLAEELRYRQVMNL